MELICPKVSILMPVYNGLPLIKASIASIEWQSYSNWECIIVDDGSDDGTAAYLDSIQDRRFIVYHLPYNYGRPVARQKSLELANGQLIALLDAGDIYHQDKIRLQVEILSKNVDVDLVGTKMCSFGITSSNLYERGIASSDSVAYHGETVPCHATCMLKAEYAKQVSYNPKLQLGEDVDYLEKYLKGKKYKVLEDVLYFYSELDSVNKKKIRRSYFIYAHKFFRERRWKKVIIYSLKYCYSLLLFPFISIDTILSKRGIPANDGTVDYYNNQIRRLIDSTISR